MGQQDNSKAGSNPPSEPGKSRKDRQPNTGVPRLASTSETSKSRSIHASTDKAPTDTSEPRSHSEQVDRLFALLRSQGIDTSQLSTAALDSVLNQDRGPLPVEVEDRETRSVRDLLPVRAPSPPRRQPSPHPAPPTQDFVEVPEEILVDVNQLAQQETGNDYGVTVIKGHAKVLQGNLVDGEARVDPRILRKHRYRYTLADETAKLVQGLATAQGLEKSGWNAMPVSAEKGKENHH